MADVADNPAPPGPELSAEERSKDDFFVRIAQLGEAMILAPLPYRKKGADPG